MGLTDWDRPLFVPGGDDAFVYLVAFGPDVEQLAVSQEDHRVGDVPDGVDLGVAGPELIDALLEPPIGDVLQEEQPALVDAVRAADSCLVIAGPVPDPSDLRYLRSSIGIATAALDAGAVAIYNLQSFALFAPDRWRNDVFAPDKPSPADFVVVIASDEEGDRGGDGQVWLHTRGMRLFGRPDLSVHAVPAEHVELAGRLIRVLIEQQVFGLRIDDGSTMPVGDPLGELTFRHRGHHDDPDFNNTHLDILWPLDHVAHPE